jgi:hypothetical protein
MTTESEPVIDNKMPDEDRNAIQHLKNGVSEGKHWYRALLEAIALWKSPEEKYNGRLLRYLIENEAFDWLLLAERLCDEIRDVVPGQEIDDLLFFDRPPVDLPGDIFKKLIGTAKYRAYLNYLYGVLVEEALVLSVCEDLRKERRTFANTHDIDEMDKAFLRVYEAGYQELLDAFRKEKSYPDRKTITLDELKQFTYWLFKYRVQRADKSRIASDTRKALLYMQKHMVKKKKTTG